MAKDGVVAVDFVVRVAVGRPLTPDAKRGMIFMAIFVNLRVRDAAEDHPSSGTKRFPHSDMYLSGSVDI